MSGNSLPSGSWAGYYVQSGRKHPQEMQLEFADGLMRGDGVDEIGQFTIDGEYRIVDGAARLGWIKTYDGAHSVLYLGKLRGEEVVGTWDIHGWGEGFALTPVREGASS